ncbi:MAG: hypothetical protein JNJ73_15025 [Hyphomonadaceae bacterium]|nr:hypothetical protein [Hyphomonadaceae bacterium]
MTPLIRLGLEHELALWRRAGHTPVLWWRDDDARERTPALERLCALSDAHALPLTLAVVPAGRPEEMAALAGEHPLISLAQHGVAHANRAPNGEPPSEITATDDVESAAAMIGAARARMQDAGAAPIFFAPPWNRTEAPLEAALAAIGMRRLSGFGGYASRSGAVQRVDVHLDVLRWGGGPRFRGEARFLARLRRLLADRRASGGWDEPIGLLTHHLDHDGPTWDFLDRFLAWGKRTCVVRSAAQVFGGEAALPHAASA